VQVTAADVEALVLYQVAAIRGVAAAEGARLHHVKPHGALYHMAARDGDLAGAVARATALVDPALIIVGPPQSALLAAAHAAGLPTAAEAFADRAYLGDGTLVERSTPGSVLTDPAQVVARVVSIVTRQGVTAVDGSFVPVRAKTICLHSDTRGAASLAAAVRQALDARGITVAALPAPGKGSSA
jgi:UPF0271 protein